MSNKWLDSLGGRKFILTIIVIIVGTAVQLFSSGGCNPSYASLLIGIVGAFSASNALVTVSTAKKQESSDDQSKP